MKYKLKASDFDLTTGISFATIQTPFGEFTGISKMHPKEKIASNFIGCENAEKRAIIKALKEQKKLIMAQRKIMQEYYNLISNMKGFNKDSKEASKARKYIYDLNDKIYYISHNIKEIYSTIKKQDEARTELLKNIRKKKMNKDN